MRSSAVDDFFEDQDKTFYATGIQVMHATPVEEVCGPHRRLHIFFMLKKPPIVCQIRPLHHSQPMNFSAHLRTLL